MANYKTFKKEKWTYFFLSIIAYYFPFIIVTACLFPFIKEVESGFKVAVGLGIIAINSIPFLMGIFKSVIAHFPMLNILAFVFLIIGTFFTLDVFSTYVDYFMWIELAAAIGAIISCICWKKYQKYKQYSLSVAATIKSGAFKLQEENE